MNWDVFWMCFISAFAAAIVGIFIYAIVAAERTSAHKRRLEEMRIAHEYEKELRGACGK
jgi:uncharacterized integral membrane protein